MCKKDIKTQQRVLKSVSKTIRVKEAAGNSYRVICVNVQEAPGKQMKDVKNHLEKTSLDFHNMQISDYRYVSKVFENLRQKLRLRSYALDEWGLFMSQQ